MPTQKQLITNEQFVTKPWLETYLSVSNRIFYEIPAPGGKCVKFAWIVNLQKVGMPMWCFALMCYFNNWSTGMWLYTALHGSYGCLWLLKDRMFPDTSFEVYISLASSLLIWCTVLGPYSLASYMIASRQSEAAQVLHPERIFAAVALYVVGIVLMVGADAQKYFTLRLKRGLISDCFFGRTRNPNYLGEIMLYAAFNVVAQVPAVWAIYAAIWSIVFYTRMLDKDYSLSKKTGYPEYAERSWLLLPKPIKCNTPLSIVLYICIFGSCYGVYALGGIEASFKALVRKA